MQFAKELYQEYKQESDQLVNTFCQLRERYPMAGFTEIGQRALRVTVLALLWANVAEELRRRAADEA